MSRFNLVALSKIYQALKVTAQQKLTDFSRQQNLLTRTFDKYEELIGVKEVRVSQQNVLKAESEFILSSRQRREVHAQLSQVQEQLKQVRQKLDSVHRGDEAYLELITNEHRLIKNETKLANDLKKQEDIEREYFGRFSQSLRDSQEVERLRQEKTKYLSIILSIFGALLGIIGTSINHAMKMKDFKQILNTIQAQQAQLNGGSLNNEGNESISRNVVLAQSRDKLEEVKRKKKLLQEQNEKLEEEIRSRNQELSKLIHDTGSNLEYKMKLNALATVAVTYALIAVTVPLFLKFFSGE